MVEFDVLDLVDGTLVLAHSDDLRRGHARRGARPRPAADARRARGSSRAPDARRGARPASPARPTGPARRRQAARLRGAVVDALRRHGVVERTLVSSCFRAAWPHCGAARAAAARSAWPTRSTGAASRAGGRSLPRSCPRSRRCARPAAPHRPLDRAHRRHGARAALPRRLAAPWSSAATRAAPPSGRGRWTAVALRRGSSAAGVDGIITNDPRASAATLDGVKRAGLGLLLLVCALAGALLAVVVARPTSAAAVQATTATTGTTTTATTGTTTGRRRPRRRHDDHGHDHHRADDDRAAAASASAAALRRA